MDFFSYLFLKKLFLRTFSVVFRSPAGESLLYPVELQVPVEYINKKIFHILKNLKYKGGYYGSLGRQIQFRHP